MGGGYNSGDELVTDIVPIESFDEIIELLKKPDVEYVKIFMYNGFPSIEKQVTRDVKLLKSFKTSN